MSENTGNETRSDTGRMDKARPEVAEVPDAPRVGDGRASPEGARKPQIGDSRPAPQIGDSRPAADGGGQDQPGSGDGRRRRRKRGGRGRSGGGGEGGSSGEGRQDQGRRQGQGNRPVEAITDDAPLELDEDTLRRRRGRERRGKPIGRYLMCVSVRGDSS